MKRWVCLGLFFGLGAFRRCGSEFLEWEWGWLGLSGNARRRAAEGCQDGRAGLWILLKPCIFVQIHASGAEKKREARSE